MTTFMGFQMAQDGYGVAAIKIAEQLKKLDPSIEIVDMALDGEFRPDVERRWPVAGTAVALTICEWYPMIQAERLIGFTMCEASGLPAGWPQKMNEHAERIIVPSEWCKEVFVQNGVHRPIEVVKLGIDPKDYQMRTPTLALPRLLTGEGTERPYTFLWSGTPDFRKGWDVAYRAFSAAFGKREDVELVLHFRADLPGRVKFNDKNVRARVGMLDQAQWRSMLAEADCFVFPSRGEGWGSPPREAAAMGLPVIATDFGGLHEDLKYWGIPLQVKGMSPAEYGAWDAGMIGEWAEPDVDHLIELMRACVEHRVSMARKGLYASMWLHENATWRQTAERLIDMIDPHPSPLPKRERELAEVAI